MTVQPGWASPPDGHRAGPGAPLPPAPYQQQMWRPGGWWRPLLAIPALVLVWAVSAMLTSVPFFLSGGVKSTATPTTAAMSLWMNVILALGIPAAFLVTFVYGWFATRGIGRLVSVESRMRWGWLGRCHLVVVPLWVLYLGVGWALDGFSIGEPHSQLPWMVLVTLLTTPLQAAGEEFVFRGALTQAIGAWLRRPWLALVVPMVVTSLLFISAHGSFHPWIMIDIGSLAVAGSWLLWRTGGLEAVLSLHIVNNLLITLQGAVFGGLEQSYVSTDTTGSPTGAAMSVAVMGIAVVLLDWQAQRAGVAPKGWRAPALG